MISEVGVTIDSVPADTISAICYRAPCKAPYTKAHTKRVPKELSGPFRGLCCSNHCLHRASLQKPLLFHCFS